MAALDFAALKREMLLERLREQEKEAAFATGRGEEEDGEEVEQQQQQQQQEGRGGEGAGELGRRDGGERFDGDPSLFRRRLSTIRPRDLEAYRVSEEWDVFYIPQIITREEARQVWSDLNGSPWTQLRSRRVKCFGTGARAYGDRSNSSGAAADESGGSEQHVEVPAFMAAFGEVMVAEGLFPGGDAEHAQRPNHFLVNEYQRGQGIMAHTDGPAYFARAATVSLGGRAVMHFRPRLRPDEIGMRDAGSLFSLVLESRSAVLFFGSAYTDLMHEIQDVLEDVVGDQAPCLNLRQLSPATVQSTARAAAVAAAATGAECQYSSSGGAGRGGESEGDGDGDADGERFGEGDGDSSQAEAMAWDALYGSHGASTVAITDGTRIKRHLRISVTFRAARP